VLLDFLFFLPPPPPMPSPVHTSKSETIKFHLHMRRSGGGGVGIRDHHQRPISSLRRAACQRLRISHGQFLDKRCSVAFSSSPVVLETASQKKRVEKKEKEKKNVFLQNSLQPRLIFRCSSSPSNPVYARRVDSSALVFSLSSHRHSYTGLVFTSLFIDS
jgi:hypothetical protein